MSELNAAQRAAVEHGDGPLLVLAGAGSGKTRVITRRVAALVRQGVDPAAIVAVSFTNKAAGEMAERMVPLVGRRAAGALRMSTFHRFGLGLLRSTARADRDGGRFVIFDQSDSLGLVREILRELYRARASRRLDAGALLARISNRKNAGVDPGDGGGGEDEYDAVAREVYPEYEARLAAMRAFDFDDLVCRPVRLLRERPELRAEWQRRIEHLLVDEFQDTSRSQLELVKLLANDRRNVCVVGDDDQSIYGWRGADVGNILEFERHFPGARVVTLETNYRSRGPILETANAVIAAGGGRRHAKTLRASRSGGDRVRRTACESPQAEAAFVAAEIRELRERGASLGGIAVLYRSNKQARLVEEELRAGGLPYRVYGGQQFFDRKEIKDTAAYLRVVVNPRDEISLRRILNYPARGIGTRSVEHLEAHARRTGAPFAAACRAYDRVRELPDAARAALRNLDALFGAARARLDSSGSLAQTARDLVDRIGLRAALDDTAEGGRGGEARWANVQSLLAWIERFERAGQRTRSSLADFLHRVTLDGDPRDDEHDDGTRVTLCTLHAAKGLEFDVVFLIGCVEGQLPHSRTTDPRAHDATAVDLDEERRLFYVGITRARERLYLSAPQRRVLRGKAVEVAPSRYLDDLPEAHVAEYARPEQQELTTSELSSLARELRARHFPGASA